MSKIKLNLRGLLEGEKIQFAIKVENGLIDNEGMPGMGPLAKRLKERRIAFQDAITASVDAEQTAAVLGNATDLAEDGLDEILTIAGNEVESAAKGDPDKIMSAGFELRKQSRPIGQVEVPRDPELEMGDMDGELHFSWRSVRGARSYEAQICEEPVTPEGWKSARPVTRPEVTFTGLTSGKRYRARTCAIGSAGPGAWSGEIGPKTAP
ncbi:MAG: hypothetical protein JWL90_2852 [Chthoniobacteraceae bacterium]|nr:hypothetical protein [Chthoniobacteraceae bacterium]